MHAEDLLTPEDPLTPEEVAFQQKNNPVYRRFFTVINKLLRWHWENNASVFYDHTLREHLIHAGFPSEIVHELDFSILFDAYREKGWNVEQTSVKFDRGDKAIKLVFSRNDQKYTGSAAPERAPITPEMAAEAQRVRITEAIVRTCNELIPLHWNRDKQEATLLYRDLFDLMIENGLTEKEASRDYTKQFIADIIRNVYRPHWNVTVQKLVTIVTFAKKSPEPDVVPG